MTRRYIDLPSFNGVAASQTATLDIPVGDIKYHMLHIEYDTTDAGGPIQSVVEADLTEFRLKVNGKVQRRFSAADLFKVNAWHGEDVDIGDANTPAFLPLWLSEPWRRTAQGEDALGWGTQEIQSLQLEVDLAASATGPALVARAEIERVREPLAGIIKWRKFTIPVSASGLVQWFPPRFDAYAVIHLIETTAADITDVKVVVDGEDVFNATDDAIEKVYATYGLTPQTGVFHIAWDRTMRVSDFLSMVRGRGQGKRAVSEFQVELNMAVAANVTALTETFGPRD